MWNGRKWRQVDAPAPDGGHGQLSAVSCWSAKGCVAVGGYFRVRSLATSFVPMSESWNGRKWTPRKLPVSGAEPVPIDVSCVSATRCLTVGDSDNSLSTRYPIKGLADSWNGRAWKAVPVRVPSQGSGRGHGYALIGVTCASATDCVTFGDAGRAVGADWYLTDPFAEHWNGKSLALIPDS